MKIKNKNKNIILEAWPQVLTGVRPVLEFELHTYVSDSFRIQKLDALNKNTVPSPNNCC